MVATTKTPHCQPKRSIILKAGFTPPEPTMTIACLSNSPSNNLSPSKPPSQSQPARSASTRLRTKATTPTNRSILVSPPKSLPGPQSMSTQQVTHAHPASLLLHRLSNNQVCLIDLSWSLPPVPTSISARTWPLRLVHDSTAHTAPLSTETLCSTPSDFRSSILNPDFRQKEDFYGLVMTSLKTFGLEREELVKTIVAYMQSGRWNSAVHNGGIYTFERSVTLLCLASRYAMVRVMELVLVEMEREFLGWSSHSSGLLEGQAQRTEPVDLTAEDLDTISRIYDTRVWKWINTWAISIFSTPKGQRNESKAAVEECMNLQGECGDGSSILQRIVAEWFKEHLNPLRSKREGELSRLRAMRPKRARTEGSMGRSPSVLSTATAHTPGTKLGTQSTGITHVRELYNSMSPTPKPRSNLEGADRRGEHIEPCEGENCREGEEQSEDEGGNSECEGEGEDEDVNNSRRGRKKRKAPVIHHVLLDHTPL